MGKTEKTKTKKLNKSTVNKESVWLRLTFFVAEVGVEAL